MSLKIKRSTVLIIKFKTLRSYSR